MPKAIHQETMCCGYKKCPSVIVFSDGSMELTDNDPEIGSVGTIKIRPEVAERLMAIMIEKRNQ